MANRLKDNISSGYIEAANKMASKKKRRRIVAYVESYDDVLFWRTVLNRFENTERYFEVMLPSKKRLRRGKKSVLMNFVGNRVGPDMIACVDADFDYLLQGHTEMSRTICESPYIFHTYTYAIENYHCYAPSLHSTCVMVTLNDHAIFDFVDFLTRFSEAIYPLLVWAVWAYRNGQGNKFGIAELSHVAELSRLDWRNTAPSLEALRRKVQRKVGWLRTHFPGAKASYLAVKAELATLGVTPQTTYLYLQGHHVFDNVVAPVMTKVCNRLRQERENEINRTSIHDTQRRNELSCYEHSIENIRSMMKRNTGYMQAPEFLRLQGDIEKYLKQDEASKTQKESRSALSDRP